MSAFVALFRKQIGESRWMLGLICVSMFALSWVSVYRTKVVEAAIREEGRRGMRIEGFLRTVGGESMDMSSGAIEAMTLYWLFLFIPILMTILWSISRGSASVAGELERGSMDLILSRPLSRTSFYAVQVATGLAGLGFVVIALVAGNLAAGAAYTVATPPSLAAILRPALNLALVGLAIFGYTTFLSALDIARWRPMLFASGLTLVQFVALAVGNQPDWEEFRWLNRVTVFSAFAPIEAAAKGALLSYNGSILAGIGVAGLILGLVAFTRRDLPATGG